MPAVKMNGIELPDSCCKVVFTSCAFMILEGFVKQEDTMGLNDVLIKKGFVILCVAYPKLELDVVIGAQIEDDSYNDQFGKYQK